MNGENVEQTRKRGALEFRSGVIMAVSLCLLIFFGFEPMLDQISQGSNPIMNMGVPLVHIFTYGVLLIPLGITLKGIILLNRARVMRKARP